MQRRVFVSSQPLLVLLLVCKNVNFLASSKFCSTNNTPDYLVIYFLHLEH